MSSSSVPLKTKLRLSGVSLLRVLAKPSYAAITIMVSLILLGILIWVANFSLIKSVILSTSLGFGTKLRFYFDGYVSLLTNFEPWAAAGLMVLSMLAGINTALLIFVKRGQLKAAKAAGKSITASAAAILGLGCAACGTSLLGPLLAGAGALVSLSVLELLGAVASLLGLFLLLYSIYGLGLQSATVLAQQPQ